MATKELDFAKKKYHVGSSGGLDLNNAQINIANATDNFVQVAFGYEVAKLNLFKALGGFEEYFEEEKEK